MSLPSKIGDTETTPETGPNELLRQHEAEIGRLTAELAQTNTGVVALYAELDDKAEQLRNISDLKSRFLSYMSHEFRTPLVSIRSISRILLDEMDGPLGAEQRRQVVFIQNSAEELSVMVDDLLDLAKIEAGRITISPIWFDMVSLFSALRGMFHPLAVSQSVDLIFEEPLEAQRIFTDHEKLSQILRNFLSNALKFTAAGEVRVTADIVAVKAPRDSVRFTVADTGIGIALEYHERIFEEYVQAESRPHARHRGTGLGLSLCRKFARLLGGEVAMQSTPGKGSAFSVVIPIQIAPASAEAPPTAKGEAEHG